MAYQALRVPIPLLHQKVYSTSHRLEKLIPLEFEKKKEEPKAQPRVIQPDTRGLFERAPYLRRFFYLVDGSERTVCRNCETQCENGGVRGQHTDCYFETSQAIMKLGEAGVCIICEDPLLSLSWKEDHNGVPVCSEMCRNIWDYMLPECFEVVLKDFKEARKRGEEKKWQRGVYGGWK